LTRKNGTCRQNQMDAVEDVSSLCRAVREI
jgi:hypothetical protein